MVYAHHYYPYYGRWGYPHLTLRYPYGYGYGNNYGYNIIGSAIANQNMNIVGGAGVVANQYTNPIAIW